MKKQIVLVLFLYCYTWALAQTLPTQTVRGTVVDADSKSPLIGATVFIADVEPIIGTTVDIDGTYKLENVPIGRHTIKAQFLGYQEFKSENIIVNSAKELVLDINLTESIQTTQEIVVTDTEGKQHKPLNEMSVVSARSFSVEETQRYPASINDPSRMAMGFAGVQANRDNNSDIIVRGNSPMGVLWRLEGIDIPNPNHFARIGSSGGGITIFSASLLSNSDFSTGAFAAEYGNAFSSVFDMRFRKGNNEKREYTMRVGLIGLDFATEGPFKKGGASYLVNYRYSTLGILNKLGVHLVGARVDNTFQDLSFNLAFPTKNKKHAFTWFGIGGLSREFTSVDKDTLTWKTYTDYLQSDFSTNMATTGITHTVSLDNKSYIKTTLAGMISQAYWFNDTLTTDRVASSVGKEEYIDGRISLASFYNRKINSKITLKTGLFFSQLFFNYYKDIYNRNTTNTDTLFNLKGNTQLFQPYAQIRYRLNNRLTLQAGVHAVLLTLNGTYSIEPRLAFKYDLGKGHSLSFGYGLHGRMLPLGSYFTQLKDSLGQIQLVNKNLPMLKSHHLVLGYDMYAKNGFHIRSEIYCQLLGSVPVGTAQDSSFWLLNERDGFAQEKLTSTGTGLNYGLDLTIEKFFGNQFFVLTSMAYYRSLSKSLDGVTRSTRFDGIFNTSFMGGKEFTFKKGGVLQLGLRLIYAGGLRYTPADSLASIAANEFIPDLNQIYAKQAPAYFRIDGRIAYRKNFKKVTYWLALDVQNATNRRNVRSEIYDPLEQKIKYAYQSGIVPVLSFQLDF